MVFMPSSWRWGSADGPCRAPRNVATQRTHERDEDGPAMMWTRAEEKRSTDGWSASALMELRRCIAWQPKLRSGVSSMDSIAQLECRGALLQSDDAVQSASDESALVDHAHRLLRVVQATIQRCGDMQRSLNLQRTRAAASRQQAKVLEVLTLWAGYEVELRDALDILDKSSAVLQQRADVGDLKAEHALKTALNSKVALRKCVVRCSVDARLLTSQVKQSTAVQQAESCYGTQLANMECLALRDTGEKPENATMFDTGLLLSEIAIAARSAPFYRGTSTCCQVCGNVSLDAEDYGIPNEIVVAEALLTRGQELAPAHERTEKAVSRATQLCKHGDFLASAGAGDAAIKSRFYIASTLASEVGRAKLAAGTLAKLSSLLSKRGLHEDALDAASKALVFSPDPLASFQHVWLRFNLWKMKSGDEVLRAARQLTTIQPGVLNKGDETARLALRSWLYVFHEAAESESIWKCLLLGDVAHVFACTFGKALYRG
eukprot:TRINITY_DN33180_c0_g1_i1.p1 TRINITY_DN33180_c0_g1~~TRINITY_DN33180_c0_g1_i1.p1  ORF type:complete len:569 (+),score=60.50 TRINITY_DN33180_c0_g1_i1:240-1709(+)